MLATPSGRAHGLVGQSPPIAAIRRLIEKASINRLPVLLLGESGTGKEVVARAIHNANPRGQFVPIDCGSLVGTLMESELFGHVKGAFSGAVDNKRGLVELADGGTAFFDEIGDLPLDMQVKLLRLIQERRIPRRGLAAMAQGGPADHRRDAPQPQRRGGRGPFPAGPVLPPQRLCPSTASPAPAQGGHSPAGGPLSERRKHLRPAGDRTQPGTVRDLPSPTTGRATSAS